MSTLTINPTLGIGGKLVLFDSDGTTEISALFTKDYATAETVAICVAKDQDGYFNDGDIRPVYNKIYVMSANRSVGFIFSAYTEKFPPFIEHGKTYYPQLVVSKMHEQKQVSTYEVSEPKEKAVYEVNTGVANLKTTYIFKEGERINKHMLTTSPQTAIDGFVSVSNFSAAGDSITMGLANDVAQISYVTKDQDGPMRGSIYLFSRSDCYFAMYRLLYMDGTLYGETQSCIQLKNHDSFSVIDFSSDFQVGENPKVMLHLDIVNELTPLTQWIIAEKRRVTVQTLNTPFEQILRQNPVYNLAYEMKYNAIAGVNNIGLWFPATSPSGKYSFVDWGDGTPITFYYYSSTILHTYASAGTYTVRVYNSFYGISSYSTSDPTRAARFIEVYSFGRLQENQTTMERMFRGAVNLEKIDKFTLKGLANLRFMTETFMDCVKLKRAPIIPSTVTSMSSTFRNCIELEGDIVVEALSINVLTNCFAGTTKAKNFICKNGSTTYVTAMAVINGLNGVTVVGV